MRSSPVTPLSPHTEHWPPDSLSCSLAQVSHREEAQQGSITASSVREVHRGQHSSTGRGGVVDLSMEASYLTLNKAESSLLNYPRI